MRKTVLGLLGLGLFGLAGLANAQGTDRIQERDTRIRDLRRQLVDLETVGRDKVLQNRGLKSFRRPAVNTAANEETFEPVTARFVRFTVEATVDGSEPCLHSLQIYSPGNQANLSAAAGVQFSASSVMPAFTNNFNGGKLHPGWCWVGQDRGKGWLEVELPQPTAISRIVWNRDSNNVHKDRIPSSYKIEVSDGRFRQTVASGEDRAILGKDYTVLRSAAVRALDASQLRQRQEMLDELKKLGVPRPFEVKSGPQVGEYVNGAFAAQFLNGLQVHVGKQRCPV